MASPVDVCNLALSLLGNDANVSAIDPSDGSVEADRCVTFYPMARDQTLARYAWDCATRRTPLALLDTDEKPGNWLYAYQRPSDCLQPIAVLDPADEQSTTLTSFPPYTTSPVAPSTNNDDKQNEFISETLSDGTQVIYTNVENAVLRYVRFVTDTTKFSPLMVSAVARLLASMLAGPLLKGEVGMKVGAAHLKQYEQVDLPNAAVADARGQRREVYRDFTPSGIAARA